MPCLQQATSSNAIKYKRHFSNNHSPVDISVTITPSSLLPRWPVPDTPDPISLFLAIYVPVEMVGKSVVHLLVGWTVFLLGDSQQLV